MELITETGATSENTSAPKDKNLLGRVMLILSAEQLAEAITRAHGVKMNPDDFALTFDRIIETYRKTYRSRACKCRNKICTLRSKRLYRSNCRSI